MQEHVTPFFGGTVLTTGTNLSNGQTRSQITGSDPQHLRYAIQGTPETGFFF